MANMARACQEVCGQCTPTRRWVLTRINEYRLSSNSRVIEYRLSPNSIEQITAHCVSHWNRGAYWHHHCEAIYRKRRAAAARRIRTWAAKSRKGRLRQLNKINGPSNADEKSIAAQVRAFGRFGKPAHARRTGSTRRTPRKVRRAVTPRGGADSRRPSNPNGGNHDQQKLARHVGQKNHQPQRD